MPHKLRLGPSLTDRTAGPLTHRPPNMTWQDFMQGLAQDLTQHDPRPRLDPLIQE